MGEAIVVLAPVNQGRGSPMDSTCWKIQGSFGKFSSILFDLLAPKVIGRWQTLCSLGRCWCTTAGARPSGVVSVFGFGAYSLQCSLKVVVNCDIVHIIYCTYIIYYLYVHLY